MNIRNFRVAASALLSGALVLFGCHDSVLPDADNFIGQRVSVEAQVNASNDTRTTLNDRRTEWVAGDRIGIFSPQTGTKNLPLEATENAASSAFDGEIVWGATAQNFYAYYPHAGGSFAHSAVPVSLPANQIQSEGDNTDHVGALDFMVAEPLVSVPIGEDVRFQFGHLFTLLEFRVIGKGSVSRVGITTTTSTRLAFSGATIDLSQVKPVAGEPYTINQQGASSSSVSLTLTLPATLTEDESTTPALYMMVNPTDLTGQQITVSVTIDGVLETSSTEGFRLDRGRKYTLVVDPSKSAGPTNPVDESVALLQAATEGNGIDIVLMGDGFTDQLIANGTYESRMRKAMESFFTEEPYKSHRGMFNVYMVDVISNSSVFDGLSTALGCVFGEGTQVRGSDQTCMRYARRAISDHRMDNAAIIVIINDTDWHGTCYMYHPAGGNYGNGTAISYSSLCENDDHFRQLLHHEAAGHAFPKLGDEYWYDNGTIPTTEINSYKQGVNYGWWKNIDLTSDRSKVKWARFLADSRYSSQGLGVYEGGYTWQRGVWRSTDNSIMRYNTGGFNAPSREAIYYRIHKLAYGAGWTYDYETFVAWDTSHRSTRASAQATGIGVSKPIGHTSPIVIPHSWREVLNE